MYNESTLDYVYEYLIELPSELTLAFSALALGVRTCFLPLDEINKYF